MTDHNFYAPFTANKIGKTGLTPTVDVRNSSGVLVVSDGSATELGGGLYKYVYSTSVVDDYLAMFKTADSSVDSQHVPSLVTAQAMKIDTIPTLVWATAPAGTVNVTGPVVAGGAIAIEAGDDYYAADGRALEWTSSGWPNLTGASVTFNPLVLSSPVAMTVVTAGVGISQVVRLELSKTQTEELAKMSNYRVVATLTNGHVVTLAENVGHAMK